EFGGDGFQTERIGMEMVAEKHGAVVDGRKHVGEENVLAQGPALVDHALQGGVINGDVGGVGAIADAGVLQGGGLGKNHVRVRDVRKDDAQKNRHVVGGDGPGIASAAHVVGADED